MPTIRVNTLSLAETHPSRDPRYITTKEIANRLDQSQITVQIQLQRGAYPWKRQRMCSGVGYFDRAEVEEWLDNGARDKFGRCRVPPKERP